MSGPIFKVVRVPSPTKDGMSNAVTGGLAPLLSAGSKAADLYPHDRDGLLQMLHFRNQIAKGAERRSHWIGGRVYNLLTGEDAEYIPVSGTHLRQTLAVVKIATPDFVVASGEYMLRLDVPQEAVSELQKDRDA